MHESIHPVMSSRIPTASLELTDSPYHARKIIPCKTCLWSVLPRRGHPVLDKDEYDKQQALIDHKKPTIDASKQPYAGLHQADPKKIVQLITADTAYLNT